MPNTPIPAVIIGSGGFGREVLAHIRSDQKINSQFELLGFIDKDSSQGTVNGLPILGNDEWAFANLSGNVQFFCAIGESQRRMQLSESFKTHGFRPATLIHESANVLESTAIAKGTLVLAGASLTTGIVLGKGCIINLNACIGHDVFLGDYVTIHPGACLNGGVKVKEGSEIGSNAVVLPNIKIGKNSIIGAGAVVTKDVPDGEVWVGVPAKKMDNHQK